MDVMTGKPITPSEALEKYSNTIPDFVIEAVNELLSEKFSREDAIVELKQSDVVAKIMQKGDIPAERNIVKQVGMCIMRSPGIMKVSELTMNSGKREYRT